MLSDTEDLSVSDHIRNSLRCKRLRLARSRPRFCGSAGKARPPPACARPARSRRRKAGQPCRGIDVGGQTLRFLNRVGPPHLALYFSGFALRKLRVFPGFPTPFVRYDVVLALYTLGPWWGNSAPDLPHVFPRHFLIRMRFNSNSFASSSSSLSVVGQP